MRRAWLTVAAVLIGSLGMAESAGACDCVEPEYVYENSAKLAFNGRLLDKSENGQGERYTYRVKRVFKVAEKLELAPGEEITLPVSLIEACGFPQDVGERYGVMAVRRGPGKKLEANGCTMTSAETLRRIARGAGDTRAPAGCGAAA